MLLQFGQYLADFSLFCHGLDLLIFSDSELMVLAYGLKHPKHFGVLFLGQKIYLEIQMISLIRLDVAAVLTHQNEQRKKNRLQRDDGRQKLEWERVEREPAVRSAVEPEPKGEPDRVKNNKPHSSCVRGDDIAYTGRKGSLRQRAVFQFGDYFYIARCRRGRLHSFMLFRGERSGKHRSDGSSNWHSSLPVVAAQDTR